jgi:flagellar biosynthesis/type III secretory pathway chaperone
MEKEAVEMFIEQLIEVRANIKSLVKELQVVLEAEVHEFFGAEITKDVINKLLEKRDLSSKISALSMWERRHRSVKNNLANAFVSHLFVDTDVPETLQNDIKESYFKYLSDMDKDIYFPKN